jgi:phenylalanyl-tRNA synthetase alpha chain
MAELTQNEKRLLGVLVKVKKADAPHLAGLLGATPEAVVQWAYLLGEKGLAAVEPISEKTIKTTEDGETYKKNGLPEERILDKIPPEGIILFKLQDQDRSAFKIGFGQLRKKGLIKVEGNLVTKNPDASVQEYKKALLSISNKGLLLIENLDVKSEEDYIKQEFIKRGILQESETVRYSIAITQEGLALEKKGLDLREETGTLTREQILSGAWKDANLRRYDIAKLPKTVCPGKTHPYQRIIDEMRQILLEMGFTEIHGEIVQSAFWNFDALFQPQDHPAREMQDTFYLKEEAPLPTGWERLRDMHEHGGETSSVGWGGKWNPKKAEQCVLRTHTTSLSIQHLVSHPSPPVKAFCIGRVYRREAIDPTHTPEFEQLEGIVMDKGVSFRNLLGYLKEFYGRMGFEDVRFRPAYFPYTEPSVEPEIFVDGLGWVEMGGAGIFREEVTAPWGITHPVLAWGLGVSRVAMFKLGLKDLRLLYKSDIEWIRANPVHRDEKTLQKGRQ